MISIYITNIYNNSFSSYLCSSANDVTWTCKNDHIMVIVWESCVKHVVLHYKVNKIKNTRILLEWMRLQTT
jgi:hypothetical protein